MFPGESQIAKNRDNIKTHATPEAAEAAARELMLKIDDLFDEYGIDSAFLSMRPRIEGDADDGSNFTHTVGSRSHCAYGAACALGTLAAFGTSGNPGVLQPIIGAMVESFAKRALAQEDADYKHRPSNN